MTDDKPAELPDIEADLQRAEDAAAEHDRRDPNFWDAVAATECRLLKHLAKDDLAEHTEEIIAGYLEAKRRDASPREFRSVLEHLDFLARMIAEAKNGPGKEQLEALEMIRHGLMT